MKGSRNILVHPYGRVQDEVVYERARSGMEDFERFKGTVLKALEPTAE